jgi:hypothetical protein
VDAVGDRLGALHTENLALPVSVPSGMVSS